MSVNERADIDYKGAEQITDSERGTGKALARQPTPRLYRFGSS